MHQRAKKWASFALRWGIAVAGIWWVVSKMSLRDHVLVLDDRNIPVLAQLASPAEEKAAQFQIWDPATNQKRAVSRSDIVNEPEQKNLPLTIESKSGPWQSHLLALDLSDDLRTVRRLLVEDPDTGEGEWVFPHQIKGGFVMKVPHPRVELGIITLIKLAKPLLLWMAILIFPVTFLITSFRWHELLKAADIHLGQARVFVLTMVGAFYNTFMPGSTGGDVLKAYYASKHTEHRTRAVMSVIIDRVIGLIALVILGGTMAFWQWFTSRASNDPGIHACFRIAIGSALLVLACLIGGEILTHPFLQRITGLNWLLTVLPLRQQMQKAIQVMQLYRRRAGLVLASLVMTFPVHATVVMSAMLCGMAFGLPLPGKYYFVCVPVIVLSGAVPISPQGAGVMEFFAIALTRQYGVTVSQAFALTMSIRVVQMAWNLTGGIFVFRGGYHAPSAKEQAELDQQEEPPMNCELQVPPSQTP